MNKKISSALLYGLALVMTGPVAAESNGLRAAYIQQCQNLVNMMRNIANARQAGVSMAVVMRQIPSETDMTRIPVEQETRRNIVRIYAAADPQTEASRIGAECLIATGLIKTR